MKRLVSNIKKVSKQNRVVTGLVVAAILGVMVFSVNQTLAYFTTYAVARGGVPIELGPTTTVKEKFKDWKKTIEIENTGDVPCFIRTKIIAGSLFEITASGSNWTLGSDGYWYYSEVVPVGGTTESIEAYIKVPEDVEYSFNVVVVQECVPVSYDEDGNPCVAEGADWQQAAEYVVEEADE